MSTSGTKTFNLDVAEIIEEALERVGGDPMSGNEARSARRSLNLLLTYLVSENAPLNTQSETILPTVQGQVDYDLDPSILNVRVAVITEPSANQDYELTRMNIQDYNTSYRARQNQSRPTTFFIERTRDNLVLKLWPIPDKAYTLRLWTTNKLEDITASIENIDIPTSYLPCICSGLAYYASLKRRDIPTDYRNELLRLFTTELNAALKEDRFREDMLLVPNLK